MVSHELGNSIKRPLGNLGVAEDEEQLYRWLLGHPDLTASQIVEKLPFGPQKVQRLLNALEIIGFVTVSPESPRSYIPTSPDIAIEALVNRHREEIAQVLRMVPELRRHVAQDADPRERVVELITSRAVEAQFYAQIPRMARQEVLSLIRPPLRVAGFDAPPDEAHSAQRKAQARGVRYRSVVDTSFLELPGALESVRADVAAGEETRAISGLPLKMLIFDRRAAMIPLNLDQSDSPALLIRRSTLLDTLHELFWIFWEKAAPISFTGDSRPKPDSPDSAQASTTSDLIALLSAGLNDKSIIADLGLSRRTLVRRVTELMDSLGARTRFQAGWLAAWRAFESKDNPTDKSRE